MPDYRFILEAQEQLRNGNAGIQNVTSIANTPKSSVTKTTVNNSKGLASSLGTRFADNAIERAVISPLNSATGGLASPVYGIGKTLATGGSGAALGGGIAGLAMAGIMLAINKIQERVAKMESKAEEANNKDNVLIRSGSKSYATYYKGSLFGVKSSTNRN